MTSQDILNLFRLDTNFFEDHTIHRTVTSDVSQGIRRLETTEKWLRGKSIGRGGFAEVYLEKEESKGKLRAVKRIEKSFRPTQGYDYLREVLSMVLSPDKTYFPELFGWYEDGGNLYIAMEYFPLGDLSQCCPGPQREEDSRSIIRQVAEALEILQTRQITHRDIKPENIFVCRPSPHWWVKLGDFGISKRVQNDETSLHTALGSGCYVAPEIYGENTDQSSYTSSVDIWSLGCVLFWLSVGRTPFSIWKQSLRGKSPTTKDLQLARLSATGLDLLQSCLSSEPEDRPSPKQIAQSEWMMAASDREEDDLEQPTTHSQDRSATPWGIGLPPVLERRPVPTYDKASKPSGSYDPRIAGANRRASSGQMPIGMITPDMWVQMDPYMIQQDLNNLTRRMSHEQERLRQVQQATMEQSTALGDKSKRRSFAGHSLNLGYSMGSSTNLQQPGETVFDATGAEENERIRALPPPSTRNGHERPHAVAATTSYNIGDMRYEGLDLVARSAEQPPSQVGVSTRERLSSGLRDSYSDTDLDSEVDGLEVDLLSDQLHSQSLEEIDIPAHWESMFSARFTEGERGRELQALMQQGFNFPSPNGRKGALHYAAQYGLTSFFDYLHRKGGDIHSISGAGKSVIHWAAYGGHIHMMGHLCSLGLDPGRLDHVGQTAIHVAAMAGHQPMLEYLRKLGVEPKRKDNNSQTAIFKAASNGHISVVNYLCSIGLDVKAKDKQRRTAMFGAAYGGHVAMVEHLASIGLSVKATTGNAFFYGETLIHAAAYGGHLRMLEHLCLLQLDVKAKDGIGRTAMHSAAYGGHLEMVVHLHTMGLKYTSKDEHGSTPADIARRAGKQVVANYIAMRIEEEESSVSKSKMGTFRAFLKNDQKREESPGPSQHVSHEYYALPSDKKSLRVRQSRKATPREIALYGHRNLSPPRPQLMTKKGLS